MTCDLTLRLLEASQVKIQKVAVTALRDNVYYASIWIQAGGQGPATVEIERAAEQRDHHYPAAEETFRFFVTSETLEQAAAAGGLLTVGREMAQLEGVSTPRRLVREGPEPEAPEMEFRSYRSLSRAEVPRIR